MQQTRTCGWPSEITSQPNLLLRAPQRRRWQLLVPRRELRGALRPALVLGPPRSICRRASFWLLARSTRTSATEVYARALRKTQPRLRRACNGPWCEAHNSGAWEPAAQQKQRSRMARDLGREACRTPCPTHAPRRRPGSHVAPDRRTRCPGVATASLRPVMRGDVRRTRLRR